MDTDKIFQEIVGQATGQNQSGNPLARFETILQAMDDGMIRFGQAIQKMSQGLDMCHFKILMILEILMDKNIVTKEELEGHYKQVVQDKINNMREQQEAKMQETMAQVQANAGIKTRDTEKPKECCGSCKTEPEVESDIVLPSEQHTKTTF